MCGIVGYVGRQTAAPILLTGLKKLEYRGYDSAGIAVLRDGRFMIEKKRGYVCELNDAGHIQGNIGIGHTRWATHGAPSERNAHPHRYGKFVVVHNGIIENYRELKDECIKRGESFLSETDSEVIAHLLDYYYCGDLLDAIRKTVSRFVGSFAIAALCSDVPDKIVVSREKSPIVLGIGENETLVASDFPAIASGGRKFYSLSDGESAILSCNGALFYNRSGKQIEKDEVGYFGNETIVSLGQFSHFMLKEIYEIPAAVSNTLSQEFPIALKERLQSVKRLIIVACGTAYHSGVAAKYAIETLARIPVDVCIASEFRYGNPIIWKDDFVLAVSQSGETADTIAAAELAKRKGAMVVAVTNVLASSLTNVVDFTLYTHAGFEISVAATKSFHAQLAILYRLACFLAVRNGSALESELLSLTSSVSQTLVVAQEIAAWAQYFITAKSVYFLGRGADYAVAIEGSLKMKEVSYLPGEGYAAGELKHGTLALVDRSTPIVVVMTQRSLAEKVMNAVNETEARGAMVFLITSLPEYQNALEHVLLIPSCLEPFTPMLSVIPLQLLAYYTAVLLGHDPDKPRNLAKSVTVE